MKCYYNERWMLQPSCCYTQRRLLCSAQSITRRLAAKLQAPSQGRPAASWRLCRFSGFFFCVTSHSLLPQWINTLKNFRIKVWILLREEKGRMGTFFLLLLQRCRLCVCVSHELHEWRRPNGDCLHQGMFAPPSYYPFCCFLLTSSQSSQLMIFCGDVRFMCSLKDAEQVFPFSAESLKIMGNMLAAFKQMCVRSLGDSDALHAVFPPNIWEPASLFFFQRVSEAKETIGHVHKSLHVSVRSCRTQTLSLNSMWHG